MSSRSLAAARSRRTGESQPPVSGNRPGTSINSHAAFVPQIPSNNVRISKSSVNNQSQLQQQYPPQPQQYPPQQVQNPPSQNKLPFTKLSVSDAVGLITLRLGRVEQWIIETEHEKTEEMSSMNLPENAKIIDNSVFTNIISRLDSLEIVCASKQTQPTQNLDNIAEELSNMKDHIAKIADVTTTHNLSLAKNAQQMLKLERDVTETKDILKTFMIKYDNFVNEISERFADYESAISELEKHITIDSDTILEQSAQSVQSVFEENTVIDNEVTNVHNNLDAPSDADTPNVLPEETDKNEVENNKTIMMNNIKEILKQELAEIN